MFKDGFSLDRIAVCPALRLFRCGFFFEIIVFVHLEVHHYDCSVGMIDISICLNRSSVLSFGIISPNFLPLPQCPAVSVVAEDSPMEPGAAVVRVTASSCSTHKSSGSTSLLVLPHTSTESTRPLHPALLCPASTPSSSVSTTNLVDYSLALSSSPLFYRQGAVLES